MRSNKYGILFQFLAEFVQFTELFGLFQVVHTSGIDSSVSLVDF